MLRCENCNNNLKSTQRKYCNSKCQVDYIYGEYIRKWKKGEVPGTKGKDELSGHIRKYIFAKYDNECCECGWSKIHPITKRYPLQVDHVDGDHFNNKEGNLRLLCPNCHVMTLNYGSLNRGKGRQSKLEYYKRKLKPLKEDFVGA